MFLVISVCHFVHTAVWGPHGVTTVAYSNMYTWEPPLVPALPHTTICSKVFAMYRIYHQARGWTSTEWPSCFLIYFNGLNKDKRITCIMNGLVCTNFFPVNKNKPG